MAGIAAATSNSLLNIARSVMAGIAAAEAGGPRSTSAAPGSAAPDKADEASTTQLLEVPAPGSSNHMRKIELKAEAPIKSDTSLSFKEPTLQPSAQFLTGTPLGAAVSTFRKS